MSVFPRSIPLALAALVLAFPPASAQISQPAARVLVNLDKQGVALQGYDPVAFFTDSRPVKGRPELSATYQGGTYYFASAEHQRLFEAAPERYAPQFGGYCAYGVSQGHTAPVEIATWQIRDGRLLLNYSSAVRKLFDHDPAGYLAQAVHNWPRLIEQEGKAAGR
jgi:YHS domain-containing protein